MADDPTADGCVFCEIVAGTTPAKIVREWPDAIAIVPLNPVVPPNGHLLVVPRTHVRDAVTRLDVTAATMRRAAELAAGHEASNVITSIGAPATQSIFHLHVHVIRRMVGDQLMVPWGTTGDPHAPHWCRVAGEQRQRAERAEAAIERVWAVYRIHQERHPQPLSGCIACTMGAALDHPTDTPGETPAPARRTEQDGGIPNDAITPTDPPEYKRGI